MRAILFTVAIMALLLFAVGCNSDNGVPDISNIVSNDVITTVQDKDFDDDTYDLTWSYSSLGSGHWRFVVEILYDLCSEECRGMSLPIYFDEDVVEVTDDENGNIFDCQGGPAVGFPWDSECDDGPDVFGIDCAILGDNPAWFCDDPPDNVIEVITFETIDPIFSPGQVTFSWANGCEGGSTAVVDVRDMDNGSLDFNLKVNGSYITY